MALVHERMNASKQPPQPNNIDPKTNRASSVQLPNPTATINASLTDPQDQGFFGSFFQKGNKKKPGVLENVNFYTLKAFFLCKMINRFPLCDR
jgi:hypothetical protein